MKFLILSCSTKDPLDDPDALLARSSRTYRDEFNRTFANRLLLTSSPFLLESPLPRIIFLGPKNAPRFALAVVAIHGRRISISLHITSLLPSLFCAFFLKICLPHGAIFLAQGTRTISFLPRAHPPRARRR